MIHRTATTDDKKLLSSLKKLAVNNIPGIEEVGTVAKDHNCNKTTPIIRIFLQTS